MVSHTRLTRYQAGTKQVIVAKDWDFLPMSDTVVFASTDPDFS